MNERHGSQKEIYSPENLMRYQTAVAVAERLCSEGLLTLQDKKKVLHALNRKYGLSSGSIFAV